MKEKVLELSPSFWDAYKIFLQGKITRVELKRHVMNLDDASFYKQECNHRFNIETYLPTVMKRNLETLVDKVLSEVEKSSDKQERKAILRKMLMIFLGNYSSLVAGRTNVICKDIMIHFIPSCADMQKNEILDQAMQQIISLSSIKMSSDKERLLMRPVIFKLLCLYICLAKSDKTGKNKGSKLCSRLSLTFVKTTPQRIMLPYLRVRQQGVSDEELLQRFSF